MAVKIYKDMEEFWKAHPELDRPDKPKNISTDKNVTVEDPWGVKDKKEETKEEVKDGDKPKRTRAKRTSTK